MENLDPVFLSRLQFGLTAMYHFLFVPLTLGLVCLLGIMESIYVMTGREVWKQMTKFWGKLFAINFAMGIATGITLEFQFGTNWAYYSHYVGDIFGVPLAIEGLMAFFLESTFVGLFLFGWDRLSKVKHLMVTWLMALGASLSALWILIANGWMQNPVGAEFNFESMRMELTSISEVFFNQVAQAKFVHTISAGYVTGSIFVLAISSLYLLKKKHIEVAKRSLVVATSFGLLSAVCVVILGDESGYSANHNQKAKIAAIEGMWETEPAPAGFAIFGWPDEALQKTHYEIKIPYVLGLIATRSFDQEMPGIKDLIIEAKTRIRTGINAYQALETLREDKTNQRAKAILTAHFNDLGYALLLKKYRNDIENATVDEIELAAKDTIPSVLPLFWSFRIMVTLGIFFILLFALSFWFFNIKHHYPKWLLYTSLFSLPLPWIAAELGWFVAEHGRQPWAIEGILPTFLASSNTSTDQVLFSLIGFIIFYSVLAVVEVCLMVKYIRLGPSLMKSKQTEVTHVA